MVGGRVDSDTKAIVSRAVAATGEDEEHPEHPPQRVLHTFADGYYETHIRVDSSGPDSGIRERPKSGPP